MAELMAVNNETFEEMVLQSTQAVLVDFWAPWCGPCKMLMPIVEDIASDYAGRVKFVKVNVDEAPEIAAKYGVRGIPTLILLKQGAVEATKVGALTKAQLAEFIDANLA